MARKAPARELAMGALTSTSRPPSSPMVPSLRRGRHLSGCLATRPGGVPTPTRAAASSGSPCRSSSRATYRSSSAPETSACSTSAISHLPEVGPLQPADRIARLDRLERVGADVLQAGGAEAAAATCGRTRCRPRAARARRGWTASPCCRAPRRRTVVTGRAPARCRSRSPRPRASHRVAAPTPCCAAPPHARGGASATSRSCTRSKWASGSGSSTTLCRATSTFAGSQLRSSQRSRGRWRARGPTRRHASPANVPPNRRRPRPRDSATPRGRRAGRDGGT